jgi:hypothetical protein
MCDVVGTIIFSQHLFGVHNFQTRVNTWRSSHAGARSKNSFQIFAVMSARFAMAVQCAALKHRMNAPLIFAP